MRRQKRVSIYIACTHTIVAELACVHLSFPGEGFPFGSRTPERSDRKGKGQAVASQSMLRETRMGGDAWAAAVFCALLLEVKQFTIVASARAIGEQLGLSRVGTGERGIVVPCVSEILTG
jgi:hypothetical protein